MSKAITHQSHAEKEIIHFLHLVNHRHTYSRVHKMSSTMLLLHPTQPRENDGVLVYLLTGNQADGGPLGPL